MGKLKKFLLVIFVVVVAILTIYYGGKHYLRGEVREVSDEVKSFAKESTKEECINEIASRVKVCETVACYTRVSLFGAGCFRIAKGDKEAFCRANIGDGEEESLSAFSEQDCIAHELNDAGCGKLSRMIQKYCGVK